jgi:hypothetical protein
MTRVSAEVAILLDLGSAWAKACLVGRSRGRWRIVGHAAQPRSWPLGELVRALAATLAPSADRRVADRLVDLVAAAPRIECHTSRRPGRLALAAVSRELSATAARRAAESAGWLVVEAATVDDGRSAAERLAALQAAEVDAWLIAGGFDETAAEVALEVAALVAAARQAWGGPVIWAGSRRLSAQVAGLFEEGAVTSVANPRPSEHHEDAGPLRAQLEQLLRSTVEPESAIHLAPVSFRRAIGELSRSSGLRVVGVDLGAQYATRVSADGRGEPDSRVYAAGGLTAPSLTAAGGPARVARIMSQPIDELAVADALQNLRARPATLPHSEDELAVTQAAARQQLSVLASEEAAAGGIDLLIGAGRVIAGAPQPAQAAQMLLDGVRPLGVTQLAIDVAGALGPLGALDDDEIEEGIGSLRDDLLAPLGTAVVCRGGRPGGVAMRVSLHRVGWQAIGPVEVRTGQLHLLPLGRGQVAELDIALEDGASLGGPRRASRARVEVSGGAVGVLLDARGVPIALPRRADDRRAVLAGWRDTVTREAVAPTGVGSAA